MGVTGLLRWLPHASRQRQPARAQQPPPMFKLLRYYSAASLVAVVATAVLLPWFYRQVATRSIVQLAERGNVNLAEVTLNPIKPALLEFLDRAADVQPRRGTIPLPSDLASAIGTLMRDDPVIARIKIYNPQGTVVFSSSPDQLGDDQSRNDGFVMAMRGEIGSELVYRHTFNRFEGMAEDDNLVQTYVPVRAGPQEPVRGVFELYGDVNKLMYEAELTQLIVLLGAMAILSALYAALLVIVRHASRSIDQHQRAVTERTTSLELLSSQMLTTEESNKRKIAFELQEGVAQLLAALKLKAESGRRATHKGGQDESIDSMIPMLQEAIHEVRSIATDLRPASLDDLGLLPTIYWLCREFQARHPGIEVDRRILVEERHIPPALKGIMYRIIISVLGDIAQRTDRCDVLLSLSVDDQVLTLSIDDQGTPDTGDFADTQAPLWEGGTRMEELTTLSGGTFAVTHLQGGTQLHATWPRQAA